MMAIGHEGLRPYVEALWGWDQTEQESRFREHFEISDISIVQVDGEDVGYTKVESHDDHVFLAGVYIAAGQRNRGIGTAVIEDLIARAAAEKKVLRLRVLRPNPCQRLYKRLGFTIIGESDSHIDMQVDSRKDP